ncbi:hypothetical protein CBR_g28735 [Chara braunii]|uniref:Uncharacterized protein n=1 Tax=Chara braunii TaxID=69332 RepID=A0A388L9W8_CHABU|nr:hypothetical protein CBR_g28735 [Chara braunii]|eukprot:GBG79022.1 hypothetical protein CBR_g28735 [Chara braunii]
MPQPPAGGQHPGGGGEGDGGDGSGSGGGGDGGDGSGSGADKAERKRSGEEGSGEKRSAGKWSGETLSESKGSDGKGSGGKGSRGKGSAGKGSGRKGSSGKRRVFGSHESRGIESHCEGSRDSYMRDEAALRSHQVRVDSHLSARTLFCNVEESPCPSTQSAYLVDNTLLIHLLEEGERVQHTATSLEQQNHSLPGTASSFCLDAGMPALRRSEGVSAKQEYSNSVGRGTLTGNACCAVGRGDSTLAASHSAGGLDAGVLETGASEHQCRASGGASVDFESKSTTAPWEVELSQEAYVVQREEETQHWQPHKLFEGLDAGVLETGASQHHYHASEGANVDFESKSTAAPGEVELSQEAHVVQREEETQHWQPRKVFEGLDAGVSETGASQHHYHASEGASVDFESKTTATPGEEELSQEAHVVQRVEKLL